MRGVCIFMQGSVKGIQVDLKMKLLLGCVLIAGFLGLGCTASAPTPTPTSVPKATATSIPGLTATATPSPIPTEFPELTPTGLTPTAKPESRPVSIAMVPAIMKVRPGQVFSVDVNVDPQARGISGLELEIRFQPDIFQMVDVVPGDLLGEKPPEVQSIIPIINIDNELGILHYTAARIGPTEAPTPPGLVATMFLRVLETAPAGRETSLKMTKVKNTRRDDPGLP